MRRQVSCLLVIWSIGVLSGSSLGVGADDRDYGSYLEGCAAFKRGDHAAAFRALAALAPFEQAEFGTHARYLIARMHHLAGERPEAMVNYQGVVAEFDRQRKGALGRLADPALTGERRERLSAMVRGDAPEHVARALFYWGVALSEFGLGDEAASKFAYAIQLTPGSGIVPEARLRGGICAVQVKKHTDAIALLTPIADDPKLGVEALRWLAKAYYGVGATAVARGTGVAAMMNAQPDARRLAAGIQEAVNYLKKARARPDAREVRAVVLLELGDMQQLGGAYKEAAESYAEAGSAGGEPRHVERALLSRGIALGLGGEFSESDEVFLRFLEGYGDSSQAPEAMVRYAENAALAVAREGEDEARKRLNGVLGRYPGTRHAHLAALGLATMQYVQGKYAGAAAALAEIPADQRVGELVSVTLMLADCQLRALPRDEPEDALSTARLVSGIENILTALEAYVQARPFDATAAEAYVRIGYAANRLHELLADPFEKRRSLGKARRAYTTVTQQFADHPLYPVALLENAKLVASQAGAAPAMIELSKFQVDPLNGTGIAPLAIMHLADVMRLRRKPDEAVAILEDLRAKSEAVLLKDANRATWVPMMRYGHALALKEAGRHGEARELFDAIVKEFPKRPEAREAAWRTAQSRVDPAMIEVQQLRKALAAAKALPPSDTPARLLEATKSLGDAAAAVDEAAGRLDATDPSALPVLQRMRQDQAWAWRVIGEAEVEVQRFRLRNELVQRLLEEAGDAPVPEKQRRRAAEKALGATPLSAVPLSRVAVQPGEAVARQKFREVIQLDEQSPVAAEARVELAELYAQRGEAGAAIALLNQAIEADAAPEIADRLRIRLAVLCLEAGDARSAKAAVEPVLQGGRNGYHAYARVLLAESLYRLEQWDAVVEHAAQLSDARRGGRVFGINDHALLRLGQAQQKLSKWEDSRDTLEALIARFGRATPLLRQARAALGQSYEKLNQPDKAQAQRGELAKLPEDSTGTSEVLTPAIPNLLTLGAKRSNWSGTNPVMQPAAPLRSAPVNNLWGTEDLTPLAAAPRPMEVEPAPLPTPLPFDAQPYLQSPAAADDGTPFKNPAPDPAADKADR